MNVKQRLEQYPKWDDGTVKIDDIPDNHKCNACSMGFCHECLGSSRCDCSRVNHGVPLP